MTSLLRKRSGHSFHRDKHDLQIPAVSTFPRLNGVLKATESGHFPPKNRTRQCNRESIDIEDVMAGSDNEEEPRPPPKEAGVRPTKFKISDSARELVDFLDAGPPEQLAPPSNASKDFVNFLNSAPPGMERSFSDAPLPSPVPSKKASGRLQKMMSRLSINQSDRRRTNSVSVQEEAKFRGTVVSAVAGGDNTTISSIRRIISKPSLSNLVPPNLVPKQPLPQRPGFPHISPPESPLRVSPVDGSSSSQSSISRSRQPTRVSPWEEPPLPTSSPKRRPSEPLIPSTPVDSPVAVMTDTNGVIKRPPHGRRVSYVARVPVPYSKVEQEDLVQPSQRSINYSPVESPTSEVSRTIDAFPIPPRTIEVMPAGSERKHDQPCIPSDTAHTIRKLLQNASNADECRVIFDLFMARCGIPREDPEKTIPTPLPSAKSETCFPNGNGGRLERSMVECLLGGDDE